MTKVESLTRRCIILGIIAAGLLVWYVARPTGKSAVSEESLPKLFPAVEMDRAKSIVLQRVRDDASSDGPVIRMDRAVDSSWKISSVHDYPAAEEKVTGFLEALQAARLDRLITQDVTTFGEYAGPDGWTRVEVLGQGGTSLATFDVGKAAGYPNCFVRLNDDNRDRVVRAYNLTPQKVKVELGSWTDANLWPNLTLPGVTRIDVTQRDDKQTLSFVREEKPAAEGAEGEPPASPETVWKMVAPKTETAEKFRVENLVRTVTGMRFEDILSADDDATLAKYGLVDPAYRIVLFGKPGSDGAGAPRHELLVGAPVPAEGEDATSTTTYVRRGSDKWVFVVTSTDLGDVRQTPEEFLPKPEEPAEPAEPVSPASEGREEATGDPDGSTPSDAPKLPPIPPEAVQPPPEGVQPPPEPVEPPKEPQAPAPPEAGAPDAPKPPADEPPPPEAPADEPSDEPGSR